MFHESSGEIIDPIRGFPEHACTFYVPPQIHLPSWLASVTRGAPFGIHHAIQPTGFLVIQKSEEALTHAW